MTADSNRYLLGPGLLMGLCQKAPHATSWGDSVPQRDCCVSELSLALVRSLIDTGARTKRSEERWHTALNQLVSKILLEGGVAVEVTKDILDKWRHWRLQSPLEFVDPQGQREEVEQDVRLLLATADALNLTYVDYASPYLGQAAEQGLKVIVIDAETAA